MPDFIANAADFSRRQIEWLAELETEISAVVRRLCTCSLSTDASACMKCSRPRVSRRRHVRRTTQGKSSDPDCDGSSSPEIAKLNGASS
jgi:hypothetical protein